MIYLFILNLNMVDFYWMIMIRLIFLYCMYQANREWCLSSIKAIWVVDNDAHLIF